MVVSAGWCSKEREINNNEMVPARGEILIRESNS
jgi:hypothetical protein